MTHDIYFKLLNLLSFRKHKVNQTFRRLRLPVAFVVLFLLLTPVTFKVFFFPFRIGLNVLFLPLILLEVYYTDSSSDEILSICSLKEFSISLSSSSLVFCAFISLSYFLISNLLLLLFIS